MRNLNCKGLACPGPVIQAKRALEELEHGGSFSMEVDSEAAMENVRRFAQGRGAEVTVQETAGKVVRLVITRSGKNPTAEPSASPVVFITGDTVGTGDEKLGRILMEGFINTLPDQDETPDRILFMNAGVKLAVEGSPVLKALGDLVDRGCEILVCGTCLDFLNLKDKLATGTVSNMYEMQKALLAASSVVRP